MKRRYYVVVSDSKYKRDLHSVDKVLSSKPSTWAKYQRTPKEYKDIIDMEVAELQQCDKSGNYHCYVENLLHVAAACLYAHHHMTCKEKD